MSSEERRQYDEKIDELILCIDSFGNTIAEHSYVIRENRADLDAVIKGQRELSQSLTAHVREENATLATVATFLRDLKGLDRLAAGVASVGKYLVLIGGPTGLIITYWDKIIHLFTKSWP